MGLLARLSTVSAPARFRAETASQAYRNAFWQGDYLPEPWISLLSTAGVTVTADLALTLSAFYSGVTTIGYDLATLPCQGFKHRDDGGKDRLRPFFGDGIDTSGGISSLAYMLRWQPNFSQTATEFWLGMVAQFLLRGKAYAEIASGPRGFVEQLLPRHPDRVTSERLPSGRVRFKLTERNGPRYLTQDEMFMVRDLSMDGLNSLSMVEYGAQTIGTILAAERAVGRFFKAGMTASVVASYKGEMGDEDETALHASISRYATGAENNFGVLLIPDDVNITNLGIEPEKAQMMLTREWGVREVARMLRMPGSKLGIKDSVSYGSQVQDAVNYVIGCLRPIAVAFEQAIQRDLVLRKDTFFFEYLLEALLRGDPDARAAYYERAIRNRWMRPSEVRLRENMNPDPDLDRLSEGDFRPGSNAAQGDQREPAEDARMPNGRSARAWLKGTLAIHDNAVRCLRRERAAVEKLARKHAEDVAAWQAGLREFYADQARFVAQVMRIDPRLAQGYAAQHGTEFEAKGVAILNGEAGAEWERFEADELAALALDSERISA